MADLADGQTTQVKGSSGSTYTLKHVGGVYSCSCPAWLNQSVPIHQRTCKHLRAFRGEEAERLRVGSTLPVRGATPSPAKATTSGADADDGDGDSGPPLLLAHKWDLVTDPTGWWLSEKLDGVRAYWDGKQMLSRLGNAFHPPAWFTQPLPATPLDGELWAGRKKFQRAVSIVRRMDGGEDWRDIRYVVFDAPAHGGVFEERMACCQQTLTGCGEHVVVHDHQACTGAPHLREELARVEALGGEGLMMRQPRSVYEVGRSFTLLKVKSFLDAEARVVDHVPGAGKHKGRLGSLLVELPDGTRFNVGTGLSDAERENPPPMGCIITFRYQEMSTGGVPRFPSFVAVRSDFRWPTAKPVQPDPPPPPVVHSPPSSVGAAPAPLPSTGSRYFELVEGSSSKFWEITVAGQDLTTRYGRIGKAGVTTLRQLSSSTDAQREALKLIQEKVKKGYIEKSSPQPA